MARMNRFLAWLTLSLTFPAFAVQSPTAPPSVLAPAANAPVVPPQVAMAAPVAAAPQLPAITLSIPMHELDRIVQDSEQRLTARIDASTPSLWSQLWPALTGVFGALLGALIGASGAHFTQRSRIAHELSAAQREVAHRAKSEMMAFRSRQLHEFYGPMRARLTQSFELRQELYAQLTRHPDASIEWTYREDALASAGQSLWLSIDGSEPRPFRLIDELSLIVSRYSHLLPHVREIVGISDLIAALIHERIGLVRAGNKELSDMLAKYLAHHSVMREAFERTKDGASAAPVTGYSAVFPRGLDRVLETDFRWLQSELANWEASVDEWLSMAGVNVAAS